MPSLNKIYIFFNLLSISISSYLALTEIFYGSFGFQHKFSRK